MIEETIQYGIIKISEIIDGLGVHLLGLGMHPTISLDNAKVWSHRDKSIYDAFDKIFKLSKVLRRQELFHLRQE